MASLLTHSELKNLMCYNPNTGIITSDLPSYNVGGYLKITINGHKYWAHRLVYFYMTNTWPYMIDHINGDGLDNRWVNLREVSSSQNQANADWGPNRGIEKHGRKFRARIWVNGIRLNLGSFDTHEEAQLAFQNGARKHFGQFAFCERP